MSEWIDGLRAKIRQYRDWKTEGKIDIYSKLHAMNNTLHMTGFGDWIVNPTLFFCFTDEELRGMERDLQELTIRFLEFNIKYSTILARRLGIKTNITI